MSEVPLQVEINGTRAAVARAKALLTYTIESLREQVVHPSRLRDFRV